MNNFDYSKVSEVADALSNVSQNEDSYFIAGGTNLIDL